MDKSKTCSSLKDSLLAAFANELEVTTVETGCIVTLPLKTVDDRYIDVFVEPWQDSSFVYVHDGGKSTAELFVQGIHETETQSATLKGVALAHGEHFQNGRFQIVCKNDVEIQRAILAVSQCAALAMVEVVTHQPKIEDEPLSVNRGSSPRAGAIRPAGAQSRQRQAPAPAPRSGGWP